MQADISPFIGGTLKKSLFRPFPLVALQIGKKSKTIWKLSEKFSGHLTAPNNAMDNAESGGKDNEELNTTRAKQG